MGWNWQDTLAAGGLTAAFSLAVILVILTLVPIPL
jgi:hypothetical protein